MNRKLANLGAMVLSLILAIGVWVLAIQDENPIITGDFETPIPVMLLGPNASFSIAGNPLDEVVLTVRAPRQVWDEKLRAEDFQVIADLTNLNAGRHSVELVAGYPGGDVEILDIKPNSLVINLEEIVTLSIPVEVDVLGTPVFGYEWLTSMVTPTEVLITGTPSEVQEVERAVVEVAIAGAREDLTRQQPVSLRNQRNEPVIAGTQIDPRSVQVKVTIDQRPGYRDFSVRVPYTGSVAPGYQVTGIVVDPSLVTLRGSPDAFEELPGFVETMPIDIANATEDVAAQLALQLPESLAVVGVPGVGVRIQVDPIITSRTMQVVPTIQGLGPGLTRTLPIDTVDLIVRGPVSILEAMEPGLVAVIIDLIDLGPGLHSVALTPVVQDNVTVTSLLPQTIEIQISEIVTEELSFPLAATQTVIATTSPLPVTPSSTPGKPGN
ncbi:MAG: CdaR family protein [Chloroflexota bacterium]|nr:CdaR family protein [Chloroflexota bacterium]